MNAPGHARTPGSGPRARLLGLLGGSSTGLGAFGALHNVCHYTCQGLIAVLAVFGISATAMPLGFLLDPLLVVLFSVLGLGSLALSLWLHLRSLTWRARLSSGSARHGWRSVDRTLVVLSAFAGLSLFSLTSGVNGLVVGQAGGGPEGPPTSTSRWTVGSDTRTDTQGGISVALTPRAVSGEELVFAVSMETNAMDAPPLSDHDLQVSAALILGDRSVRPSHWSVDETGHMGHHIKGTLAFAVGDEDLQPAAGRSIEVAVEGVGGIASRRFAWTVRAR